MAFTLRQLQYFIAVAEEGTVSGAAQSLSISQSAVTEAIKELESDLGVILFERHRRGLTITHKGHQFYRHANRILADVQDARQSFIGEGAAPPSHLSLGVTSLVAGYVLSDLLARFRRAYPGVNVSAIEDNGDYLEHLLIGGELDVAVMVISNLRDRNALQAEIFETSPYRLWLPLGHKLAAAESIALSDLSSEPLIMLTVDETEENTGKLLSALGAKPHVAFRTRSCPIWSTAPGRWKATELRAGTFQGPYRWSRSAWFGAAAPRCPNLAATSSALPKPKWRRVSDNEISEFPIFPFAQMNLRMLTTRIRSQSRECRAHQPGSRAGRNHR
jgi:DNA-binding transcriptional LysR family regulator